MKTVRISVAVILVCSFTAVLRAQQRAALSATEVEKLRDTQDPSERIKVYLGLMQSRLITFEINRSRPVDRQVLMGKYLSEVVGQYVDLDDELKDWIQFQYSRDGDMRSGLHALLDQAPHQLEELKHAQQNPDPYTAKYRDELADAVADLEDTLNGASTALSGQEKKLGELKQQEKLAKKASKVEVKAEKKQIKKEEKLRKREEEIRRKSSASSDVN